VVCIAVVKLLIAIGVADVNSTALGYKTPLKLAVENRHLTVVKLLLDAGKNGNSRHWQAQGISALCWAIQNNHEAVVELLHVCFKGSPYTPVTSAS